jgi:hypothetical protein
MSKPSLFTITAETTYRPFRVPPRCRKPRQVEETFTHTVTIPSVTSADAPVVALIPNDRGHLGAPGGGDAELRADDGKLWTVVTEERECSSPTVVAGSDHYPSTVHTSYWIEYSRDAAAEFESGYRDFLVIDGMVWRQTKEPAYCVLSLGMGNNHGGTYLDIEVPAPDKRQDRIFTLTDHEGAIAGALAIAERYGDDQSYERIRNTPKATILDPSAFKVPTEAQRIAKAEDEARQLAAAATAVLRGKLSHETLQEAKKLLKDAESVLWKHGLDTVPPTTR